MTKALVFQDEPLKLPFRNIKALSFDVNWENPFLHKAIWLS